MEPGFSEKEETLLRGVPARSWTELDTGALLHNFRSISGLTPQAEILPIIKANAYGHGVLAVAEALQNKARAFGVANLREAWELRQAGFRQDLVVLGTCLPGERSAALSLGCTVTVSSAEELQGYAALAREKNAAPARVHFKIDTGMGRLGEWKEEGVRSLLATKKITGCKLCMISSHLSAADEDEDFTLAQLRWFASAAENLRAEFPAARFHILNSAGILRHPEFALDLVRPGLMLYGVPPVPVAPGILRPAMRWMARVALLRKVAAGRRVSYGGEFVTNRNSVLAILSVGYADGFFRQIRSGTARVLIGGKSCPVVGRVTMDQIVADVTDAVLLDGQNIAEGDAVTLMGRDGEKEITAGEIAAWAGTIPWHVFTAIGPRVQHLPLITANEK